MRPTPSTASFASTVHSTGSSSSPVPADGTASILRHLNFTASVPIHFTLAPSSSSNRGPIESLYLQVPRITYLAVLVPTIKKQFLNLVLGDDEESTFNEEQVWFTDTDSNQVLRSHWSIGLLYDYHHATTHHSLPLPLDDNTGAQQRRGGGGETSLLEPVRNFTPLDENAFSSPSTRTLRAPSPSRPGSVASASTTASRSPSSVQRSSASPPSSSRLPQRSIPPWRITIHLEPPTPTSNRAPSPMPAPPQTRTSSSLNECKVAFMARYKEGDYVRFGNVKKRLVNLRREEQDQLWLGVLSNDFEKYWSIADKLIPSPQTPPTTTTRTPTTLVPNDSSTTTSTTGIDGVKNLAIKVYLPPLSAVRDDPRDGGGGGGGNGGATILTSPVTPFNQNGQPTSLGSYLSTLLPLLFPSPTTNMTTTTGGGGGESSTLTSYAIVQGIVVPLESELNWLASCMSGVDGWVNIVVAVVVS